MARVKVATTATVIATGPGSVLINNVTETHPIWLEVGVYSGGGQEGGTPKPIATEAEGYEYKAKAGPLVISLANGAVLTGITVTAEQEVHVLRDGPR